MAGRSTNGTRENANDPQLAAAEADAAEAEAAEAEALAAAAAARAKAARLRQQAQESRAALAESEAAAAAAVEDDSDSVDVAAEPIAADQTGTVEQPAKGSRRWVPAAATGVAVIALIALLTLSGLMIWSHHKATQREALADQFSTGARQGVVNLMSLNFNNGQADLQRVLDSTTGSFHDDFQKSQKDFLTVMQDSKVVTSTAVNSTAIESMNDDSAVVLITATSQVANNASQQPSPRSWRLSVTVNKENDQIKMSKVEFVP